jgi:hypothetical protein
MFCLMHQSDIRGLVRLGRASADSDILRRERGLSLNPLYHFFDVFVGVADGELLQLARIRVHHRHHMLFFVGVHRCVCYSIVHDRFSL